MAENEVECSTFSRFHLHDLFVVKTKQNVAYLVQ